MNVSLTYPTDNFDNNVTEAREIRTQLIDLRAALNASEANAINGDTTNELIPFPTELKDATLPGYADDVERWLVELNKAANSGVPFDLVNAPSGEGGILGTRLLDENGMEYEQLIEKGLFGAALFNHAVRILTQQDVTVETIDQLVEIFGASPAFPGDDKDPNNPDVFAAQYAERRSNNVERIGFYYGVQNALLTARAGLEDGRQDFIPIINEALTTFLNAWEASNFATVIYYCNEARSKIADANNEADSTMRDQLLGDALHAYAEAVGFTFGWLGLSNKIITDTQIRSILDALKSVPGRTPESYLFAQDASTLTSFTFVINQIQIVYGFTDEQVTGFFVNN